MGLWADDEGKWNDFSCKSKLPFICQRPFCDKNESNSTCFKGKSYNITKIKRSWEEATEICEEFNGTLAILNHEDINNFILSLWHKTGNNGPELNGIVKLLSQLVEGSQFFLQFLAVHSQLTIIIGLCMDGGYSLTSKFLRTKFMQFLGRISLSLYLIHWPLIGYIVLAMNGKQNFDNMGEIFDAYVDGEIFLPAWSPVILIIISPVVAFIVTKYFEEPIAKVLKDQQ